MDDPAGRTELHYAALEDRADDVRRLLAQGAEPSAADMMGFTPLHFAAQEQSVESARLLVEAGADATAKNRHGNSPLFTATFSSRDDHTIVELLLGAGAGADPSSTNAAGVSPRQLAETKGNDELVRILDVVSG